MAIFTYEGFDSSGSPVSGSIEAVDRRCAVSELAAKGHFASEISDTSAVVKDDTFAANMSGVEKTLSIGSSGIKSRDILVFTTQLSTAINAGLPILSALEIIEAQQQKVQVKQLLTELARAVSSGQSLSDAMSQRRDAFSDLYISMIRVGEAGGILEQTTKQLATLLSREEKVKSSMASALIYPVSLLVAGVIAVIILLTAVMPKMIKTIGVGQNLLPLPTRIVMSSSDFLIHYFWILIPAVIVVIVAYSRWKNTPSGRFKVDSYKLKTPVLGSVLTKIAVGRFARTLGALTGCGITILHALGVVRDTLGNEVLAKEIDEVASKVSMGDCLADPLAASGFFPPLLVQLVSLGEQTGKLDELLLNAAETFDEDSDAAITRFITIFPVLIIILVAVLIGFIIIAMILPIMSMDMGM